MEPISSRTPRGLTGAGALPGNGIVSESSRNQFGAGSTGLTNIRAPSPRLRTSLRRRKRFVAEGGRVAINGRDAVKLQAAAREIDPTGKKVVVVTGDVANPATGIALIDAAVSRFGQLDMLANNAGVFTPKPFLELTEADYDWNLNAILKGSFFTAQAAAKAMKDRGGAIVQTGSMWAIQAIGATPSSAYSAAKAGVHALTRNLAIELERAAF